MMGAWTLDSGSLMTNSGYHPHVGVQVVYEGPSLRTLHFHCVYSPNSSGETLFSIKMLILSRRLLYHTAYAKKDTLLGREVCPF